MSDQDLEDRLDALLQQAIASSGRACFCLCDWASEDLNNNAWLHLRAALVEEIERR